MECSTLLNFKSNPILPSLLAANPLALGQEVEAMISAGIQTIHLDIMDNHYVPTLTYGPLVCKALSKQFPQLNIDVHLMVAPVDALIQQFADAGATQISIHPDATLHLDRSLQFIRQLGISAGIALNPATTTDCLTWCHHLLDFVLMMTVNPGFGGQQLIQPIIPKITEIKQNFQRLKLCVDGGVSPATIEALAKAGADQFVVGTALFSTKNYAETIHLMLECIAHAHQQQNRTVNDQTSSRRK